MFLAAVAALWPPIFGLQTAIDKIVYVGVVVALAIVAIVFLMFNRADEREERAREAAARAANAEDRKREAADHRTLLEEHGTLLQAHNALLTRVHSHTAADKAERDARRAAEEAETKRIREIIAPPTLLKVQGTLLARDIYGFVNREKEYGLTAPDELLENFDGLFGKDVLTIRGNLAEHGRTDALLDRFTAKQEDLQSMFATADAIERLASTLPEDPEFLKDEADGAASPAVDRYVAYMSRLLQGIKQVLGKDAAARHAEKLIQSTSEASDE